MPPVMGGVMARGLVRFFGGVRRPGLGVFSIRRYQLKRWFGACVRSFCRIVPLVGAAKELHVSSDRVADWGCQVARMVSESIWLWGVVRLGRLAEADESIKKRN
jgi:hypothetical protein